jgi:uncharacterized protein (TIGR03000 family)
MYSLVFMAALANTPGSLEFNGYFRDRIFGNGCTCSGNTCSGCNGCYATCSGCTCYGGGLFSGDRIRALFSIGGHGCGCQSQSCCGCTGVQYACCGTSVAMNCTGSYFMDSSFAIGSCYGMPMMPSSGMPVYPSTPTSPSTIPPTSLPMTPYAQPAPAEIREYTPKNQLPMPGGAASAANRATVTVRLPADARLIAEGKPLALTGSERTFVSPELPGQQEFTYSFKIEYERNGRTLSEQQSVKVAAGRTSRIEFNELVAKTETTTPGNVLPTPVETPRPTTNPTTVTAHTTGHERARIQVRVPAGATLFVNDAKQSAGEFKTPPLPKGEEFIYTMKVQVQANGYPETITQQVKIRAGDSTTVDFTSLGDARAVSR